VPTPLHSTTTLYNSTLQLHSTTPLYNSTLKLHPTTPHNSTPCHDLYGHYVCWISRAHRHAQEGIQESQHPLKPLPHLGRQLVQWHVRNLQSRQLGGEEKTTKSGFGTGKKGQLVRALLGADGGEIAILLAVKAVRHDRNGSAPLKKAFIEARDVTSPLQGRPCQPFPRS
jgi:hypothetical protein